MQLAGAGVCGPPRNPLGALLLPAAIVNWNSKVTTVGRLSWTVAGALLVLFSAMNYFTHIGLLMNTSDSL
jgi:hypothetical protein